MVVVDDVFCHFHFDTLSVSLSIQRPELQLFTLPTDCLFAAVLFLNLRVGQGSRASTVLAPILLKLSTHMSSFVADLPLLNLHVCPVPSHLTRLTPCPCHWCHR